MVAASVVGPGPVAAGMMFIKIKKKLHSLFLFFPPLPGTVEEMQKASQRICGAVKLISTGPLLMAYQHKMLLMQATRLLRQTGKVWPICDGCTKYSHSRPGGWTSQGMPAAHRAWYSRLLWGFAAHGPLIGNAVNPAYWLIWVISEENVSNLCRKCCNWIFATRIIWRSTLECMWRPPTLCWTRANICSLNGPAALQRRVNFQIS